MSLFLCCVNPLSPCPTPGWVVIVGTIDDPIASPVPYQLYRVGVDPSGAFIGHADMYTYFSSATNLWEFCTPTKGDKLTTVGIDGTCSIRCWNGTAWVDATTSTPVVYTGSNLDSGAGAFNIFTSVTSNDFRFRALEAGANISLSLVGNRVRITGSVPGGGGEANTAANLGSAGSNIGAVFLNKTGVTLNLRRLASTSAQLTVTETATQVQFALTKTIPDASLVANIGTGAGIWKALVGTTNQLKSLLVSDWVTATSGTDDITLGVNWASAFSNVGGGAEVWKDFSTTTRFRTLIAGTGIQVTQNTNDITITGLYAAANVGASGIGVYKNFATNTFNFYKLLAGAGITISLVGDNVVITNSGSGGTGAAIVASQEHTTGTTTLELDGDWTIVPFETAGLSDANISFNVAGTEATFNATDIFIASAKATVETGSGRAQHAIRMSYWDGATWTPITSSLSYAYTPSDSNDLQTIHTGLVSISATATNKVRVEVMATSGVVDATLRTDACSIVIYRAAVGP